MNKADIVKIIRRYETNMIKYLISMKDYPDFNFFDNSPDDEWEYNNKFKLLEGQENYAAYQYHRWKRASWYYTEACEYVGIIPIDFDKIISEASA
jgi:hypothetical protein